MVKRLRRRPLTAKTGVRVPMEVLEDVNDVRVFSCAIISIKQQLRMKIRSCLSFESLFDSRLYAIKFRFNRRVGTAGQQRYDCNRKAAGQERGQQLVYREHAAEGLQDELP